MIRLHAFAVILAIRLSGSVLLADFTVVKLAESDFARPVFNTFEGSVFFGGEHLLRTNGFSVEEFRTNEFGLSRPIPARAYGDSLMIWATNDHEEVEWFAYSNGDVRSVPDLSEDNSTFPTEWFEIGDQFVFAGESDAYGRELFVYDGERVEIAADLWAGTRSSSQVVATPSVPDTQWVVVAGQVSRRKNNSQLFSVSQDGYRKIDFPPFVADSGMFDVGASVTTEDYVYFTACSQLESVTCQVLAANETTAEALIEYSEIDGPLYSRPRDFVQYGGSVYFVAHAGTSPTHHLAYLHRIDGTTVTRTTQLVSDVFSSEGIGILLTNGPRLLTIDELGNFVELVTQDSSPIITDLKKAFVHDGKIYFNTPDNELYAFDGTQVTKSADDPVNLNYTFAFSTQSTPVGIFYSSRDRQMGWTDGVSKVHIFDGLTRYSNSGGVFANGAYFFHGEDETGPGLFKIVRSNSIARVDVNANGIIDVHDIDLVARSIRDGSDESGVFDFNDDGQVDLVDYQVLIHDFANTVFGDANLDMTFDSRDLVQVFTAAEYEDEFEGNSTWASGDWNADGEFTSSDIVAAFRDGGYRRESVAVPEPTMPLVSLLLGITLRKRTRS